MASTPPAHHLLSISRQFFLCVFGLSLLAPAAAQAANCLEWDLSQRPVWNFRQGKFVVNLTFTQHGTGLDVSGNYYSLGDDDRKTTSGNGSGFIMGHTVQFKIFGGSYTGVIADDGSMTGNTVNAAETEWSNWDAPGGQRATCAKFKSPAPAISAAPSSPPPPLIKHLGKKKTDTSSTPPAQKLATVKQDVDVYAQPGGVGKPIGVLRAQSQVSLVEVRSDQWCHVEGSAVPSGGGWVWDDGTFLNR